jgi:hypothetical protein
VEVEDVSRKGKRRVKKEDVEGETGMKAQDEEEDEVVDLVSESSRGFHVDHCGYPF